MEILEKYRFHLETEKAMKKRSVQDYMVIAEEICGRFDVLNGISYRQINDTIAEIKERKNYSQSSVYKLAICTKHLFKWLKREGYRTDNPYEMTDWKKPRPSTPKFLTQEQFDSLIDENLTHQELCLLYLLWETGARISEIASLVQQNIDLVKNVVNIPYEISKGNYSFRNIPIKEKCADILLTQFAYLKRKNHFAFIFVNADNEPMTTSGLQKVVANIGMRKSPSRPQMRLSCHMFRHSYCMRMLEKNVPELLISKLLGHSSLQTTHRYANFTVDSVKKILELHGA